MFFELGFERTKIVGPKKGKRIRLAVRCKCFMTCLFLRSQVSYVNLKLIPAKDGNRGLDPTPNCDGHISAQKAQSDDSLIRAWRNSQVKC